MFKIDMFQVQSNYKKNVILLSFNEKVVHVAGLCTALCGEC